MEHIVDLLRDHGFAEIVSTLHYLADEIETWFGDGSAYGVTMHYVVEDTPLGTAGAVKMAHDLLAGEPFLIISGDALTDIDLTALVRHHREQGNDVTIALQRVTNPRPDHALSREAVVGRGILRHDQHRHLRARARDP
jgi:mannose-1-phosphate guanylyltransferase/phosphomannomutase